MKARVTITITKTNEVCIDQIIIGEYNLAQILSTIHSKTVDCIRNISIENQSDSPDYQDVDSPLYAVLDLIEKVRGF